MAASAIAPPFDKMLKGLRKWITEQFGWKLMNLGNILSRPLQTDTYSCSICALSTIAHGIFGDPLWTQRNASAHRLNWFLELTRDIESNASGKPVRQHGYSNHWSRAYI